MAVLEERVRLLWEFQLRRGHHELIEKGLAYETIEAKDEE